MAEIKIVPVKRSRWAWIIVLIILLLVGWMVYQYFFAPLPAEPATTTSPATSFALPAAPSFGSGTNLYPQA